MSERIVLLHSPLLGGLTWQAVAADLRGRGRAASAPSWPVLSSLTGDFYRSLATALADELGESPAVVVAHSGAGALIPALESAWGGLRGVIFADAILPHPGRSWFDTAPPQLAESLRAGAEFGMLPSWERWWPPGALERLVPDATSRDALIGELAALPLDYFAEPAPTIELAAPAAFLRLSGAYDEEARGATRQGWPVVSLPLHHLAMLTHPEAVASAIASLADRMEHARG